MITRRTAIAVLAALGAAGCAGGRLSRGEAGPKAFLGVFTDPAAQKADGLWRGRGLLILEVFQGSPAAMAGVRRSDVLTRVDGIEVDTGEQFDGALAGRTAGERVKLTLRRGGVRIFKEAILVDRKGFPRAIQPRDLPDKPRTFVVSPDEAGALRTLAAAQYRARRGDTLELRAGEYGVLHLWRDGIEIRGEPGVVVEGINGAHQPANLRLSSLRVQPAGRPANRPAILLVNASNVRLHRVYSIGAAQGLYVAGSRSISFVEGRLQANRGPGAYIDRSRAVEIKNSLIEGNAVGVEAKESDVRIVGNVIVRNGREPADGGNAGVLLDRASAWVAHNTIADNRGGDMKRTTGIRVEGDRDVRIEHNIIAGHAVGLRIHSIGALDLDHNAFWGNGRDAAPDEVALSTSSLAINPQFTDPEASDYTLKKGSLLLRAGRRGTRIGALGRPTSPKTARRPRRMKAYAQEAPPKKAGPRTRKRRLRMQSE